MTTHVTAPSPVQPVGPPPPFDPELAPVLDVLTSIRPPDAYRPDTIVEMRQPVPGIPTPTDDILSRDGAYLVRERTVPGPDGDPDIALLVCLPRQVRTPVPAIYFIHGGGMIVGDNRFGLPKVLDLAEPLGTAVVSVEYRLAPETPHPGPVEDSYAGLRWLSEHADELGVDPGRVVVAGMSAGGGLAAGVALMARDRGGPTIAGQLLLSPMLDDRNDSPSARQMRGIGIWDNRSNETGWNALLGEGVRGGGRMCPRTPRRPAPRTCPACHPPSSTSAQPRRSGTRTSPSRAACSRPAAAVSCTSGPAVSTGSTSWHRPPRSPGTRSLPARRGCTASWAGEWAVQTSWGPGVRGGPFTC